MRLAVFTNKFPSRISTFFARDMRALIDAGVTLDIFPFYPLDSALWRYVPDLLNEDVLPRERIHHIGLRDTFKAEKWLDPKLRRFAGDMLAVNSSAAKYGIRRLAKTVYSALKALAWARQQNDGYDHVLAYWGNYAATSAFLFHRLLDRSIPFSMFLHAGMDLYEGPVYMREKLLYADNVIVVCDFNRRYLRDRYPDIFPSISHKIHKYHLGIDLAEFRYVSSERQSKTILAVGALEKYKGFDYLLRAGELMKRHAVDYEIAIAGDGSERNSLKSLADNLNIQHKVRFLGWLRPDEVRKAMSIATLLVHPSNGVGDAVPTVIKEAMALGTPVVASSIAGIPELLHDGKCGLLVPPGNPSALADAIETLLKNQPLRMTFSESGRKYAEQEFDLWQNGRRLAALLASSRRLSHDCCAPAMSFPQSDSRARAGNGGEAI